MNNFEKVKPAFDECKNCIVLCSDNGFMPATSVLIQSIAENANPSRKYDIVVMHSNITEITKKIVANIFFEYDNISVRFVDVSDFFGSRKLYTANRKNFTKEAYYRILAPWILCDEYKSAFYIDGDMIALKDISPIFDIDIGDNLIGAIRDYWGICNCYIPGDSRRAYRESIGLTDIDAYVISSTILFNLAKFREELSVDKIIELSASRNWVQHDQDVLNIICRDSIYYLSADWGYMRDWGYNCYNPQYILDELDTATDHFLIHFGGLRKPWYGRYELYDLEFWRYADHTPYFSFLLNKVESKEYRGYVSYHVSGGELDSYCTDKKIERVYKNVNIGTLSQCHTRYRNIEINGDMLHLEGMVGFWAIDVDTPISVFFEIKGKMIPATKQYRDDGCVRERDITTYRGEAFELDYKLGSDSRYYVKIYCEIDGIMVEKVNLGFERFFPLSRAFSNCYYHHGDWIVTTNRRTLLIRAANKRLDKECEKNFTKELWNSKKKANRKAVLVRKAVKLLKKFVKKPIWLISDRLNKGDENGEVFFKYLNKEKKNDVNSYYVINKDCPDYKRIRAYGKVIPAYSYRHKILHLLAEFSISSQTDEVFRNPFRKFKNPYLDMLSDVKFVFLQHGVTYKDCSKWLRKKGQYFAGFVCSGNAECDSILNGNYNYDDKVVWLTGMPRYDLLEDNKEKVITIISTWRKYLTKGQDHKTGIWRVIGNFSETDYASFYRNLLQSKRLREALNEMGYKIQIKLHPIFAPHLDQFGFDESVNVVGEDVSYREIFSKSSLIVTDYSSVCYDFAYLHKPTVFAHFDAEEFFSGKHSYEKGDYDYERDGFGEVTYDLESTIDMIIEYMKSGCQLKEKYRERIDSFFAFHDKNNCQRVYEKIRELDAKK